MDNKAAVCPGYRHCAGLPNHPVDHEHSEYYDHHSNSCSDYDDRGADGTADSYRLSPKIYQAFNVNYAGTYNAVNLDDNRVFATGVLRPA